MDNKKIKQDKKKDIVDIANETDKTIKDDKDEKIAELDNQLKRAVADYRNLERRSSEERIEAIKFANKEIIRALLPAFDTLFLAGKYTQDTSVQLTITRILEVLKENGIEKINTDNVKYNADTMECIDIVEGEKDKVIEEVRPGFIINGRLIRPAQVKVGNSEAQK